MSKEIMDDMTCSNMSIRSKRRAALSGHIQSWSRTMIMEKKLIKKKCSWDIKKQQQEQ